MATKSSFVFLDYLKKTSYIFSQLFFILFFCSCVSLQNLDLRPSLGGVKKNEQSGSVATGDEEIDEGKKVDTEQVLGRSNEKPFRPKLAVILGPGLARSFAHIGLLKKLIEADIPIKAIVGLGWGSFAAYEYSSEGSVHGLEWRLSRSKEIEALTKTSMWSSEVKPKNKDQIKALVSGLLSEGNSKGPLFGCSLMSGVIKKVKIGGKKSIADCVAVPPLLDSGSGVAPYLMDVKWVSDYLKSKGIEKVLFINVLNNSSIKWGDMRSKVRTSEKWYWNFVENSLNSQHGAVDHVFNLSTSSYGMLDFSKTLQIVRSGYRDADRVVRFLQTEYQF